MRFWAIFGRKFLVAENSVHPLRQLLYLLSLADPSLAKLTLTRHGQGASQRKDIHLPVGHISACQVCPRS